MGSGVSLQSRLGRATAGDIASAGIELAIARLRLKSGHQQALTDSPGVPTATLNPGQAALVERVAFVIPRVAARLPWRADCLVQALAARRWLGRHGVATTLTCGVPRDKPADFEAHAWLTAGTRIVTGGEIRGYVPFTRL